MPKLSIPLSLSTVLGWLSPPAGAAEPSEAAAPVSTGSVSGVARDEVSGAPLAGAHVFVDGIERAGTDAAGGFLVDGLGPGRHSLVIELSGHAVEQRTVELHSGEVLDLGAVALSASAESWGEITVTPGTFSMRRDQGTSEHTLSGEQIRSLSWAEDATRAVAHLPGISSSD